MRLALFVCLLVLRNCAAVRRKEKGRGDRDPGRGPPGKEVNQSLMMRFMMFCGRHD